MSDLPCHKNISTLDLVSNKTKGSQSNHIHTVMAKRSSTFEVQLSLGGDLKKHLAARKFLALQTKLAKTFRYSSKIQDYQKDMKQIHMNARYCCILLMEKNLQHLAIWDGYIVNYSNESDVHDTRVCRFFPSTVPPEQPLFNAIAEISRRSQT